MKHGTENCYKRGGCRCRDCTDAVLVAMRRRAAKGLAPDDPRHGRPSTYSNWRCRCEACTTAWAEYHRRYMNADPRRMKLHAERRMALYRAQRKAAQS